MKLIGYLRHKTKILTWFFKKSSTPLDFLASAIISMSAKWNGELNPVLSYICMFDTLRQRGFSGSFLELGGGYSTIILPNILDMTNVSLVSVDLNPDKYNLILNSVHSKKDFLVSFNSVQKPTVTLDEAFAGLESLRLKLAQFDEKLLREVLSKYVRSNDESLDKICDCIFSDNSLNLKKLIMNHHAYAEDLKFYKSSNYEMGSGYCSSLVGNGYKLDAVFFDCGEISSVGEWMILSDSIVIGGYVLLHDIFYPKSIKNFLIATYIELSKDWEVIYKDEISSQGALVAIKRA